MSGASFSEPIVEEAALAWLHGLGWTVAHGPEIAVGIPGAERSDPGYRDVTLGGRLRRALVRLNPHLPAEAIDEAFRKLTRVALPTLLERNRAIHRMLVDGVTVEHRRADGSIAGAQARVIDFERPAANDWLAVNQFTVVEAGHERRSDIVDLFARSVPAFAQAIASLVALPWPVFAALWTALQAALLLWLSGRHALLILLLPPVALSVLLGQLDLAFAIVALVGLRWPVVWVLPLLTKVTPGIALIWFLVRGEWRSLTIALGATGVIAGASYLADPQAWSDWIGLLHRREFPELGGGLIYLPVSIWLRLPLAALLVAWGARTDRRWVLPVGICLALPTIWLNSPRGPVAGSLRPLPPPAPRGTVRPGEEEFADVRRSGG